MRSLVTIFRGLFSIEWPLKPALRLGRSLTKTYTLINLVIQGGVREIT